VKEADQRLEPTAAWPHRWIARAAIAAASVVAAVTARLSIVLGPWSRRDGSQPSVSDDLSVTFGLLAHVDRQAASSRDPAILRALPRVADGLMRLRRCAVAAGTADHGRVRNLALQLKTAIELPSSSILETTLQQVQEATQASMATSDSGDDSHRHGSWLAKHAVRCIAGYRALVPAYGRRVCIFEPSCSRYAETAICRFGLFRGLVIFVKRFWRCRPGHTGGLDPVPTRGSVGRE